MKRRYLILQKSVHPLVHKLIKQHGTAEDVSGSHWLLPDGRITGEFDTHADSARQALRASQKTSRRDINHELMQRSGVARLGYRESRYERHLFAQVTGKPTDQQISALHEHAKRTGATVGYTLHHPETGAEVAYGNGLPQMRRDIDKHFGENQ